MVIVLRSRATFMEEITKQRFNALGGYARRPNAPLIGEEICFFEAEDGSILGLIIRDLEDGDFAGMAFGSDAKLPFLWTSMTQFLRRTNRLTTLWQSLLIVFSANRRSFIIKAMRAGIRSTSSLLCIRRKRCIRISR